MKIRLIIFFIFMGIFSLVFLIGSTTQVSKEEAQIFMEQFAELVEGIDGFGIFAHNTTIALPMFIPGIGVAWGLFAAWSTGVAFSAIATIHTDLQSVPPLSILYLTPFGIMEVVSYTLGISRSYILLRVILKKTSILAHLKNTIIEMAIVVGLLLVGGYLEFYLIDLAKEGDFAIPGL